MLQSRDVLIKTIWKRKHARNNRHNHTFKALRSTTLKTRRRNLQNVKTQFEFQHLKEVKLDWLQYLMFQEWTVCSNMREQACQQPCSSWPAKPCLNLSTTMSKLASSTMFKPVNNHDQTGQLNHEQACQQPCSSWPAQPWTSLSTTMFKLASLTMFKPVNNHVQAGQLNHVQTCQQLCSSWPA